MKLAVKRLKLFVLLAALIVMVPQRAARAQSTTIVIGEIQTRGSSGASDEFVEFYNLSAGPVDVSGYRLYYRSCTGTTDYTRYTFPESTTLQPYQHYLITGSGYDGTLSGDGTFGASIADCGGLQLRTGGEAVIDSLAYTWSGGTVPTNGFAEGTYFGLNPHDNTGLRRFAG
jgi:hypothetical protein